MTSGPFGLGSPGGFTADDFFRLLRSPGLPQSFGLGGPQAAAPQPQNLPPGAKGPPVRGLSRPPMAVPPQARTASAPAPFGFGPLPSVSPQDVAQLGRPEGADASGAGGAGAIGGTAGAVDVPLPPARPPALSFGPLSAPAPQQEPATTSSVPSDAAGISSPPLPPPRPFGFGPLAPASAENTAAGAQPPQGGDPRADMPVSGAVPLSGSTGPSSATPPAAEKAEPSMMDRFVTGLKQSDDLLLGIGTGLMSTHGFGNGLAAGLKNYEGMSKNRAATDLARAELGLKVRKAQREAAGDNQTVALLMSRGHSATDAQAMVAAAGAGHGEALANALGNAIPKAPANFRINPDGSQTFVPGSEADPAYKRSTAEQVAAGTNEGTPEKPYNLPEGQVRYDGATNRPIASGPPKAPTVHTIERDDGTKSSVQWDAATGTWREVDPAGSGAPRAGNPFASGKFNENQGKAAGFSDRMFGSEKVLRGLEGINSGWIGGAAGSAAGWTPNVMKSEDRQRFEQAKADFLNAQLRRESGAAIHTSEFENGDRQYFPVPGDTPAVIAQKRLNRQRAVSAMAREGGPAYRPESIFDENGAIVANPMAARQGGQGRQPSSATPPPPTSQGQQQRFQQLMQSGMSKDAAFAQMHREGY